MKKSILILAAFTLMTGAIMTSCNTPAQKVENAQDKVTEANQDLDKANQAYLVDIENYRKENADKIAANDQIIAEFKTRIEDEKIEDKADYNNKITELNQKNSDMKKKLDDYKTEGKEKWEIFKTEFSHDMDELGKAFNGLNAKI
ncbi:MAG: hypothetical protein KFF73_07410 [Cyclobacteriaceae bacterium]|nr:hypothetical protein [Cyclobacteriaceae bacterium]